MKDDDEYYNGLKPEHVERLRESVEQLKTSNMHLEEKVKQEAQPKDDPLARGVKKMIKWWES